MSARILRHALCAARRPRNWRFHLAGIAREFTHPLPGTGQYQTATTKK